MVEAVDDEEKNGLSHADSVELNKSTSLHTSVSLTVNSYELQSREAEGMAVVEIEGAGSSHDMDLDSKVTNILLSSV